MRVCLRYIGQTSLNDLNEIKRVEDRL